MASTTQYHAADSKVFDYVIIGGGTAGLVLAARLTEDPSIEVIVLEAGEARFEDPNINVPGFMGNLYGKDEYDWSFKTTPQPALDGRIVPCPRGKVLGGSSAINYLFSTHASRGDLDNWEKLGNPGWNYDNLQPYFLKSETYNLPDDVTSKELETHTIDPSLHGDSGPIQISHPQGTGPGDHAWSRTLTALGLGVEDDPRRGTTLGGYATLKSMDKKGKRSYAAPAYYKPNAGRQNLTLLTSAMVEKIDFEKSVSGITATGVRYSAGGKEHFVRTRGEVLLCAGAIQSPQILELSGVGEKTRLDSFGIEVVLDSPNVGENLQDHPLVGFSFEAKEGVPTAESFAQPGVLEWALSEYNEKGSGPLAHGASGTGFFAYSQLVQEEEKAAVKERILKIIAESKTISPPLLKKHLEIQEDALLDDTEADIQLDFGCTGFSLDAVAKFDNATFFQTSDKGNFIGIFVVLEHTFSRGVVHIQSTNPRDAPLIDPRYLVHPLDLELLINSVIFTQTIASTAPLADLLKDNPSGDGKLIQPSIGIQGRISREAAEKHIRRALGTSFHPLGTTCMAPRDEGGVVDTRLKVYGIENLRVVDAGIMPLQIRGNLASAVYAIAERAADLIKEDWRLRK